MSFWGKLALVAAGTVIGAAATRAAREPGRDLAVRGAAERTPAGRTGPARPGRTPRPGDWRSRLYRFAAAVRAGMAEREAELRESFGVAAPGTTPSRLGAGAARPQVLDATTAATRPGTEAPADPTDPSTSPEGKHR